MRTTVAALLVPVLLLTGCATGAPPAVGGTLPPTTAPADPPPVVTTAPPGTSGQFNATDVAWLQLTVAMAERLLPLLDLVTARTTDPAWRRLATRLAAGQHAHLARSRRLLVDSRAPASNPHEGHDMPGMVTDEELVTLRAASGSMFHRLVAGHLRAHLTQSVRIAAAERRSGAHPATTALAAAMVRAGTAELARLDQLDRQPTPTTPAAQPARRERTIVSPPTSTAISPTTSAT